MLRVLTGAWSWLVDGAAEVVDGVLGRLRAPQRFHVALDAKGAAVKDRRGATVATLVDHEGAFRFEPPTAGDRLTGGSIEVECPPDWLFRRKLDPVAAQGVPFLDAFVRQQIDRLTPWRVEDVDFCVRHAPMPGDASRIVVECGVLPRRLTGPAVAALRGCRPARLVLTARAPQDERRFVMLVEDRRAARQASLRPLVTIALAIYLLAWPAALAWLWLAAAGVEGEIAEADQVIADRKAVLAAAARHDRAGIRGEAALIRLRQKRPRAVDLIDALSAALPDSAYATSLSIKGAEVRVSGVSADTSGLVPALEASGSFVGATFFDTTTRLENNESGDRFHIVMQAVMPAADRSLPTPP